MIIDETTMWTPKEFAALLNVSVRTLKRWHDSGKLVACQKPSGRRFYTKAHYARCFGSGLVQGDVEK